MRLGLFLILFAVFSLMPSCASGPEVNYCMPGTPDYGCANGPISKVSAVGMACFNTLDNSSLMKACELGNPVPKDFILCLVVFDGDSLACSDGNVIPAYGNEKNFVCLSRGDLERVLIWCKRKKK